MAVTSKSPSFRAARSSTVAASSPASSSLRPAQRSKKALRSARPPYSVAKRGAAPRRRHGRTPCPSPPPPGDAPARLPRWPPRCTPGTRFRPMRRPNRRPAPQQGHGPCRCHRLPAPGPAPRRGRLQQRQRGHVIPSVATALTAASDEHVHPRLLGGESLLHRAHLGRHDDARGLQPRDPALVRAVTHRHDRRRLTGDNLDERVVLCESPSHQPDAELAGLPRDSALLAHPFRRRRRPDAEHAEPPSGGHRCSEPTGADPGHRRCHNRNPPDRSAPSATYAPTPPSVACRGCTEHLVHAQVASAHQAHPPTRRRGPSPLRWTQGFESRPIRRE